jgi:hypothetical protein
MCRASLRRVVSKQQTSIIGPKSRKTRTPLTTTSQKETTPLWISFTNTTRTKRQILSLSVHSLQVQIHESKFRSTQISVSVPPSLFKLSTIPQNKKIVSHASYSRIAQLTKRCTHRDLSSSPWLWMSSQLLTARILTHIILAGKSAKEPTP